MWTVRVQVGSGVSVARMRSVWWILLGSPIDVAEAGEWSGSRSDADAERWCWFVC